MGSHASPDLWISAEKNPRSAELRRTFCDVEFRRKKKSAEVRYTICVVEFRRRTKSVKKQMQPIKGHRPPKVPPKKKKSADLRTSHAP